VEISQERWNASAQFWTARSMIHCSEQIKI